VCFGCRSVFEDTYVVHLPWWWFHATAAGYSNSDPEFLDVPANVLRVKRGQTFATISIPVQLKKLTTEQAGLHP
jgi:hypothetical protein